MRASGEQTGHQRPRGVETAKMQNLFSRRRVMTILGAAAGLPLLASADQPKHPAPLLQWRGTALGCPSRILLHHPDRAAAERAVIDCVGEIERLEQAFGLKLAEDSLSYEKLSQGRRLRVGLFLEKLINQLVQVPAIDEITATQIPNKPLTGSKFGDRHAIPISPKEEEAQLLISMMKKSAYVNPFDLARKMFYT